MQQKFDLSGLRSSWTKYDIVQVMDAVASEDKIEAYKNKEAKIDTPILLAFLGIPTLKAPTPSYWFDLQNYPKEKKLFALFAVIFTHIDVIKDFADKYCRGGMKGVFYMVEGSKQHTNIRSALVESGASPASYRREPEVPFDFSPIYSNGEVGKLFKLLLKERIARTLRINLTDDVFYNICLTNNFHKAISVTPREFECWLEGNAVNEVISKTVEAEYTIDQFFYEVKRLVNRILQARGWDLAFELSEHSRYYYLLKLRPDKATYVKDPGKRVTQFELPCLTEFYNTRLKSVVERGGNLNNTTVPAGTIKNYLDLISHDLEVFEERNPDFAALSDFILTQNLSRPQYVRIQKFFSIELADLVFENASKEVYFLGENGDGKSLILMSIYLTFNSSFINNKTELEKTGKILDLIAVNNTMKLSGRDDKGENYGTGYGKYLGSFIAYGTHRGRYSSDTFEEYGCMSLFDSNQTLISPIFWLKDQKLLEIEKTLASHNVIGEIKDLPNSFPTSFLEQMFFELLEKNVQIKIEGNDVKFIEKGTLLNFEQLSDGYKGVLIFVVDLIYRLHKDQAHVTDIADFKGVVMVDEIDLHLHPKWQRVLVQKLRTLFPNIQFIFTTHSPTIIQGASDDAIIFRVYRDGKTGKTSVSEPYKRKDLDHLMINTILTSPLFGLEDARMDPENNEADTSSTYLLYRINKKLVSELNKQKADGKDFISDEEIDDLIQKIMNEELGSK